MVKAGNAWQKCTKDFIPRTYIYIIYESPDVHLFTTHFLRPFWWQFDDNWFSPCNLNSGVYYNEELIVRTLVAFQATSWVLAIVFSHHLNKSVCLLCLTQIPYTKLYFWIYFWQQPTSYSISFLSDSVSSHVSFSFILDVFSVQCFVFLCFCVPCYFTWMVSTWKMPVSSVSQNLLSPALRWSLFNLIYRWAGLLTPRGQ